MKDGVVNRVQSVAVRRAGVHVWCAGAAAWALCASAWSMDASAANQLLQDNKCTKCHTVDRKKDGPAYRDVAAKFKTEADAVKKVIHHMTAGEKVKFPDGHEETHKKVKVANEAELNELAQWILSLEGGKKY